MKDVSDGSTLHPKGRLFADPAAILELDDQSREFEDAARRMVRTARTLPGYLRDDVVPAFRNRLSVALAAFDDKSQPNLEEGEVGDIVSRWNWISIVAAEEGDYATSIALEEGLLAELRRAQSRLGRLHKGTPLHQIGWAHGRAGRPEIAEEFFVAAMTEDILRDADGFRNAPAASTLSNVFNKRESFFAAAAAAVKQVQDESPIGDFALTDPAILSIVESMTRPVGAAAGLRVSLPFDYELASRVREWQAGVPDVEKNLKGVSYEVLVAYLFRSLGKFDTRGRVAAIDTEHDLILRDERADTRPLGEYVLVECKNWEAHVGAPTVREFTQKVRSASCHSGVLVAKSGVTGKGDGAAATFALRTAYHRDGIVIIVLEDEDLQSLIDQELELSELLRSRYESVRFDEPSN